MDSPFWVTSTCPPSRPVQQALDLHHPRVSPASITIFGIGLGLLALTGLLVAVAVWRCGVPRAAGVPAAVGLALFLPQLFAPPAVRTGHDVLLGAGLVWLGLALTRTAGDTTRPAVPAGWPGEPPPVQEAGLRSWPFSMHRCRGPATATDRR